MNGAEHFAEAERLLVLVGEAMTLAAAASIEPDIQARVIATAHAAAAQAQVHATLAMSYAYASVGGTES